MAVQRWDSGPASALPALCGSGQLIICLSFHFPVGKSGMVRSALPAPKV